MRKIERLSDHTINQIAAGEVIENPASVVKELVENSLDAGATQIRVEIVQGGLQKIKVQDDGSGMGEEDALLCLERHATSKIRAADDLMRVMTMGFRGEALASIAAISKMTITTALADSLAGVEVITESGEVKSIAPCARTQGTTIEVKYLFYNMPARLKFQKSASACSGEIFRVMTVLGLAHPFVTFTLCYGEEKVLHFPKEEGEVLIALQRRIERALGKSFLEGALVLDASFAPCSCQGVIASIENTKPNRMMQYSFLNGRAVNCPAISYAVKDALGTRIGEGRFPAFVLHMGLQTSFLDINVHPQKKEVRLREEKWLRQQLQEKIQEALVCKEGGAFACVQDQEWKKEDFSFSEDVFLLKEQRPASSVEPVQEDFSSYIKQRPELIGLYDIYAWVMADSLSIEGLSKEGMVIIDLCSAASRVLFDALVKKGSHSAPSQGLLIPLPFPCSSVEEALVQEKQEEWQSLGFSLEPSRQGFLINAIPASLSEQEASEFLTQLLFNEKEALLERKLAAVCSRLCHSSKNKHTLVTAQALIMTLLQSSSPSCCPLGRKIMVPMGRGELEQLFTAKRR